MKRNKYIYAIIEVIILIMIVLLAYTYLNKEYLFQWVAHNWKFYLVLSVIVLLLLFLNKQFVSAFMTIGIAFGIFVGNFLGRSIKTFNEGKIVEGMKAEEVYRLQHHRPYWI